MSDGPIVRYRAMIRAGEIHDDPAQRLAVEKLQLLHMRLTDYVPAKPKRVGIGMFGWGREKIEEKPVPGLYLYGGVGRGKSMLMDLFCDHAPVAARRRVHFHAFMQEIHEGITRARKTGVDDPIEPVASKVAEDATLLCFDELQITDITDAMIVGRLFERLFARGVVIVTTSNRAPDELYKNGLNRQLFLPFIDQIKDRLEVHHLIGGTDFRQNQDVSDQVYFTQSGEEARAALDALWSDIAGDGASSPLTITISGREISLPVYRDGIARVDFEDLCGKPLGPADFLAIAETVDTLFLDNIPVLGPHNNNEAKRFVTLIDALYEAGRGLICSAAAAPDALYPEGAGSFEFARTASRLSEMQSAAWVARIKR